MTAAGAADGTITLTANEAGRSFNFAIERNDANDDFTFGAVETVTANRGDGSDDVGINGKTIDLTAATDLQEVVSTINTTAVPGVDASADDDGNLILTSVSGENIKVETLQETSGEFFDTLQNKSGEKNALSATLKIGGHG